MEEKTPPPRSKKDFSFKPLHSGVGFHTFEDGLPYRPISKSSHPTYLPSTGIGATQAGPSRYQASKNTVQKATPTQDPPADETQPAERTLIEPNYDITYLMKRATAYLFDTAFNFLTSLIFFSFVFYLLNIKLSFLYGYEVMEYAFGFFLLFNWSLITAQEIAFGTTLAKRPLGLRIEGSPVSILIRALTFIPSSGLAGLGLIWGLFDSKKRCLHDYSTGIQPIETAEL